ncbi:MAG: hypothetical protein RL660_1035 [Bacteroidota bacterium]|jgi:hypothetical protein
MQKYFYALTVLLFFSTATLAQCMLQPVALASRVQNSTQVVEAKVLSKTCAWDDNHLNIYTIYSLQVTKRFKGTLSGTIKVIEQGGTVGLEKQVTSNVLNLAVGNAGLFTLIPSNEPFSPSLNYFECYAAVQGGVMYDAEEQHAADVFADYTDLTTDLYASVEVVTGSPMVSLSTLDWSTVVTYVNSEHASHHHHVGSGQVFSSNTNGSGVLQSVSAGATITSFNPSAINAGKGEILTINGNGFGATRGTSEVQFNNANNPGTWLSPLASQYLSWSNTQIQVRVPNPAGTGNIRVTDGSNTATSSTALQIDYNITNLTFDVDGALTAVIDSAYIARHINSNSTGGYTFRPFSGFSTNAPAKTDLTNVVDQWSCASGINWYIGTDTSINATANDNVNIVRFDVGAELGAGVLGTATSRYSGCQVGSVIYWYVREIDITIDDASPWFYGNVGTPTFAQLDFYSVMLHEVGHATQLGHVVDNNKVMHYAISSGVQKRVINATELAGAQYVVDTLGPVAVCGKAAHLKYICNPPVTLSTSAITMAENGGSVQLTATITGVNNNPVVVTVAYSGTAGSTDRSGTTTITIAPGTLSASITLSSTDDAIFEGNETVIVDITSVSNGTESGVQQQTVTIIDNETTPTVSITSSPTTVTEGGTTTVTATLSNATTQSVTINLGYTGTANAGSDYTSVASITIPALATTGTIAINTSDDAIAELTETIIIDVSTASNATESGTQQNTINVQDNEPVPVVTFVTTSGSVSEALQDSFAFQVVASNIASYDIVASIGVASGSATSGSDYTGATASLTITAGNLTSNIANVYAVDDAVYETNESVTLQINSVSAGTVGSSNTSVVTVVDDEAMPTVTLSAGSGSITETGGTSNFAATLSHPSAFATSVSVTYSGDAESGDYNAATSISIPALSTSGTATVAAVADAVDEDDEQIVATIASASGASPVAGTYTISITDDDAAPTISIVPVSTSITETVGGTASTDVQFVLSAASEKTVSATYALYGTATSGSDYTMAIAPISIAPGALQSTVTLTEVADIDDEATETVGIGFASTTNATIGTDSAIVSIVDNDEANIEVEVGSTTINALDTLTISPAVVGATSNYVLYLNNLGTAAMSYVASVAGSGSGITTITGGTNSGTVSPNNSQAVTLDINPTCADTGTKYIEVTVTSNAQNFPSYVFTLEVMVEDTTAPVPDNANIDVVADCSTTLTAPTATDNCSGSITGTTTDATSYAANGTYIVTWNYTDASGNTTTQLQTVTVQNNITAAASITSQLCNGGALVDVTATGGSGTYNGIGVFSPTSVGNYTYTVSDVTYGCTSETSVTIDEAIVATLANNGASDTLCSSANYNASNALPLAVTTSAPATTILWTGANFDANTTASVNASLNAGINNVAVTVEDANGCVAVDTIVLYGRTLPVVNVVANPYTFCEGSSGVLNSSSSSTLSGSTWTGGVVENQAFVATSAMAGTYTVTGTDLFGCTDTDTTVVNVDPGTGVIFMTPGASQSTAGTTCVYIEQVDGATVNYTDVACSTICRINDGAGGNVLGGTDACVTVGNVLLASGTYYAPRHYQITPTRQGPATITLYFAHSDLMTLDSALAANGLAEVLPDTTAGTASYTITQVPGGGLPGGTQILHSVTATWIPALQAWETQFGVTGFSSFYLNATGSGLAVEPAILLEGSMLATNNVLLATTTNSLPNAQLSLSVGTSPQSLAPLANLSDNTQFVHSNAPHTAYYQATLTTATGKKYLSNIVALRRNGAILYPNPTTGQTTLSYYSEQDATVELNLLDATGRSVWKKSSKIYFGENQIVVPLQQQNAGNYILQISKKGAKSTSLLVTKLG